MKHRIFYDSEKDVLREKLIGPFTADDVSQYLEVMKKIYATCDHKQVIVDLSEATHPFYDEKTQALLVDGSGNLRYFDEKVAFLKASPDIRRLVMEVVEAMRLKGKPLRTGFFDTEVEALAWLKGG